MNEAELEDVWRRIFAKKGLEIRELEIDHKRYLRTNFEQVEPGGSRNVDWLLDFRNSINPTAILAMKELAAQKNFDCAAVFLASTVTTSSAGTALMFPNVKLYDFEDLKSELAKYPEIPKESGFQVKDRVPHNAETLLQRLQRCRPGQDEWREYEKLVEDVFNYLFVPPLEKGRVQSGTGDRSEIRDIIFPNRVESGLWKIVRDDYKGRYVVVDAKNRDPIEPEDVEKLKDYLGEQLGYFGILPTRTFSDKAEEARHKAFTKEKKMIVLLDDMDILNMIKKKTRDESHEDVILDRLDLYHIKYAY